MAWFKVLSEVKLADKADQLGMTMDITSIDSIHTQLYHLDKNDICTLSIFMLVFA